MLEEKIVVKKFLCTLYTHLILWMFSTSFTIYSSTFCISQEDCVCIEEKRGNGGVGVGNIQYSHQMLG